MMLLLIDTSREEALVALIRGGHVIAERRWHSGPAAGREVLEKIRELLDEAAVSLADIDRIAVHAGPAKRSSALRAGVTVANLLAYAGGAELVSIIGAGMAQQALAAAPVGFVVPQYP